MNHKFWLLLLLGGSLLGLAAWSTLSADRGVPEPFRMEPEARPILAKIGVSPSRHPKLGVRASGALYVLAVHGPHKEAQLSLFTSHDGGDTFAPPIPVSEKGTNVSSHGENSPSLAFGTGAPAYYALWEQQRAKRGTDLLFARSVNFGRSFQKPVRVTDKSPSDRSSNSFASLSVAPNGHIYAVWLDQRDAKIAPPGTGSVYLARSTDGGVSFEKNQRVALGVCPCCRPQITFGSDGEVHVAFRGVFEGSERDIAVATSRDGGETFEPAIRVAQDNWRITGCPHSGASLVHHRDKLYAAWFTQGNDKSPRIYLSWSDDGGKTFEQPINVSGDILDPNHPMLSVSDDGDLVLVFQGRGSEDNGGWGTHKGFLVAVSDSGEVSRPQPVPGNHGSVSYPAVVAGTAGRVLVAWTEPDDRGTRIMLSRTRRSSKQNSN